MSQAERKARRSGRAMLQMYREWDPRIQAQARTMGATCRPGCHHCCNLPASMALSEAVAIADHLMASSDWPERRRELEKACRGQVNLMAGLDLFNKANREAFFMRQVPCIFLSDGKCSVYPVRPLVCRLHYAVTPPENCKLGAADPTVGTINFGPLEMNIGLEVATDFGEVTGGPIPVTFTLALWRLGVRFDVDPEAVRKATWNDAKVTRDGDRYIIRGGIPQ